MFENLETWYPINEEIKYDYTLTLEGKEVSVVQVAGWNFDHDGLRHHKHVHLYHDQTGVFYAVEWKDDENGKVLCQSISVISPRAGLKFILARTLKQTVFRDEVIRLLDAAPALKFGLSPQKPVKRRRKVPTATPFAVQLELATGLVEVVKQLAAAPSVETLADACRKSSAVHTAIHAPENFKLAAAI